jgi:hypothetical protein
VSGRPEQVWLLGYPVQLGLAVAEHVEDWIREFKLIALGRESGTSGHDVPDRLMQMVTQLTQHYAAELSEPDRLRAAAAARGEATVDLPYPVRPESEMVVRGWQRMLTEVDDYCRAQELLTLQRTPEQVALLDWVTGEFLRQLDGQAPTTWADAVASSAP